jgi:hypothetical protein
MKLLVYFVFWSKECGSDINNIDVTRETRENPWETCGRKENIREGSFRLNSGLKHHN